MKMGIAFLLFFVAFTAADDLHQKFSASGRTAGNVLEGSQGFWKEKAQNILKAKLEVKENTNKAKNIIFFIGDGMSIPTIAATRMYAGGKEETDLSFEKFPHYGLTKTYCLNAQTADSSCTATAFLAGIKINVRTTGVKGNVKHEDCYVDKEDYIHSIAKWAQDSCMGTGFVTTTKVTHATPQGFYASTSHRDWEDNSAIEAACGDKTNVIDIATQLVHGEVGKKMKVIMGGGRRNFIGRDKLDDEGQPGLRTDGKNLIDEWLRDRNNGSIGKYIWHKKHLNEIDYESTDYLMGLFDNYHLMYHTDIVNNNLEEQEPSLADMTVAAIKMLQKEKNGYFLFIEGGMMDNAHHSTKPQKALEETKELARAVEIARWMTSEEDTLIVVSSDHSHTMTYNGYPKRYNDILGLAEDSDMDGLPFETLSYANGPGHYLIFDSVTGKRVNLTGEDFRDPERIHGSTVPMASSTHASEDVGVYASGPWSHLFVGHYEQNVIPLAMAYAAKIGPYADEALTCSSVASASSFLVLICSFLVSILIKRL